MVRTIWCFQGFDSGCLETLRPFYHLRTSTGGLIIVKTSKNKHSVPFLTNIQAVNSRQNIPNIAPDSGSQMTRNDLAALLELSTKIEGRNSCVTECFCVDFWHFNFFFQERRNTSNSADQNHSIPNCSQDRKSRLSYAVNHCIVGMFSQLLSSVNWKNAGKYTSTVPRFSERVPVVLPGHFGSSENQNLERYLEYFAVNWQLGYESEKV